MTSGGSSDACSLLFKKSANSEFNGNSIIIDNDNDKNLEINYHGQMHLKALNVGYWDNDWDELDSSFCILSRTYSSSDKDKCLLLLYESGTASGGISTTASIQLTKSQHSQFNGNALAITNIATDKILFNYDGSIISKNVESEYIYLKYDQSSTLYGQYHKNITTGSHIEWNIKNKYISGINSNILEFHAFEQGTTTLLGGIKIAPHAKKTFADKNKIKYLHVDSSLHNDIEHSYVWIFNDIFSINKDDNTSPSQITNKLNIQTTFM